MVTAVDCLSVIAVGIRAVNFAAILRDGFTASLSAAVRFLVVVAPPVDEVAFLAVEAVAHVAVSFLAPSTAALREGLTAVIALPLLLAGTVTAFSFGVEEERCMSLASDPVFVIALGVAAALLLAAVDVLVAPVNRALEGVVVTAPAVGEVVALAVAAVGLLAVFLFAPGEA